jgi:hypothetical protein
MAAPTCLEILTDALAWRGVLREGGTPSARQTTAGMNSLRALYLDIINSAVLGRLYPVTISADYVALEQTRILNAADLYTVTLPETISYGSGVRAPYDRSVVLVEGTTPASYLYDSSAVAWLRIETLVPESPAPMAAAFREGLTAALCTRLRYPGQPLDPMAIRAEQRFFIALTHHYADRSRGVASSCLPSTSPYGDLEAAFDEATDDFAEGLD